MTIYILATLKARPEFRDTVESALRKLVLATRQEPGNLRYDLYCEGERTDVFHIVETYRDAAALALHRASEHYLSYREQASAWLTRPSTVRILDGVDVVDGAVSG